MRKIQNIQIKEMPNNPSELANISFHTSAINSADIRIDKDRHGEFRQIGISSMIIDVDDIDTLIGLLMLIKSLVPKEGK